jgi:hypothetical protein
MARKSRSLIMTSGRARSGCDGDRQADRAGGRELGVNDGTLGNWALRIHARDNRRRDDKSTARSGATGGRLTDGSTPLKKRYLV